MVSGIVPTMIYYGMQIIRPEIFLVSSSLLCALVSLMIGSSWTTVATIGLALMGIGKAHGFDDGWIAGSIITGAYFGDKLSPLSDTTVLASSVSGTPLFTHIRYMLYTTVPTFTISILIFLVAGFTMNVSGHGNVAEFMEGLQRTFVISPWLLLVPVMTGVMIARRWPSMVVLFLAIFLAVIVALLVQSHLIQQISGEAGQGLLTHYKGMMQVCYGSTDIETGRDGHPHAERTGTHQRHVGYDAHHLADHLCPDLWWCPYGDGSVAGSDACCPAFCQRYGLVGSLYCRHVAFL